LIAVDTNVLVYAHRRDSEWHAPAERVMRSLAGDVAPWAIPWPCLHEFLAIATHPSIYDPPTPLGRALDQIDAWLEAPSLVLLAEREGYWERVRALLASARVAGARVHGSVIVGG
jgi:predicted nucleic acid-binding protein